MPGGHHDDEHRSSRCRLGDSSAPCRRARSARRTTGTSSPAAPHGCGRRPGLAVTHRCRAPRRSARRRRPSPASSTRPQRQRDHLQLAGLLRHQPAAVVWSGEAGNQTAKTYRIQVANDPSFAHAHRHADRRPDDRTPPTTACTPTAPTSGACRPCDAEELRADLVPRARRSPRPARPSCRARRSAASLVSGTTPFRWTAQAFAASYTVEVYKNNDQTFSAANRIFSATVRDHRRTRRPIADPGRPATPYLWRVRRNDAVRQPGPVVGAAVVLLVRAWRRACSRPRPASG